MLNNTYHFSLPVSITENGPRVWKHREVRHAIPPEWTTCRAAERLCIRHVQAEAGCNQSDELAEWTATWLQKDLCEICQKHSMFYY